MIQIKGKDTVIKDHELKRRERENREYLMRLTNENLLVNYQLEAGRYKGRELHENAHGGWESPVCQLRGHFLGHWLSAAAIHYDKTGDMELKSKADAIIDELLECQKDNGGEWVGPIPEKYLYWIAEGKEIWAPQYTIHKLFMGLADMYKYTGSQKALQIANSFADWILNWSGRYSREKFDEILDVETGGMLEVWADLLDFTGHPKYKTLLERYYRSRLFKPLLEGSDPLTNMHANTTIPEILGCARAYEVTGDKNWLDIVEAYWKCAVTDRGYLVTGGQTSGEVWMPKKKFKARLGDKNQEFCTVYNMIRLAEFLFRQTGDPAYMQYMEYNFHNGIMAQSYYQEYTLNGYKHDYPKKGLLTYFLPMKAGLRKEWAGETDSFFCCHGTMVQANAALNRCTYYVKDNSVYICQYFDSSTSIKIDDKAICINQARDNMSGSLMASSNTAGYQVINDMTSYHENMPQYRKHDITISLSESGSLSFTLALRIPDWIISEASIYINDVLYGKTIDSSDFYKITRQWTNGDRVSILLPIGIKSFTLPDDINTVAFRYGPDVLAGLCETEKVLITDNTENSSNDISAMVEMENEREWGSWRYFFKIINHSEVIQLRRLRDIGYEPYQIYFSTRGL